MFHHIHLRMYERAVRVRDGKPERALGPGRYTLWKRYEVTRWNTDDVTFTAPAIVLNVRVSIASGPSTPTLRCRRTTSPVPHRSSPTSFAL